MRAGAGDHHRRRSDLRVGAGRLLRDPAAGSSRAREPGYRAGHPVQRAGRSAAQAPALSTGWSQPTDSIATSRGGLSYGTRRLPDLRRRHAHHRSRRTDRGVPVGRRSSAASRRSALWSGARLPRAACRATASASAPTSIGCSALAIGVPPAESISRGLSDGGTPWDVRWQGPPFPDDRVSFDSHARVKDMDIEGVDVNMVLPSGGIASFSRSPTTSRSRRRCTRRTTASSRTTARRTLIGSRACIHVSVRDVRRLGGRDPALREGAVAGRHLPDLPAGHDARRSRLGADLGGGAGARPDHRDPLVHDDGPVSAGHVGQLGQRVPACARPATCGTPSATWRRSSARACSIAIRACA